MAVSVVAERREKFTGLPGPPDEERVSETLREAACIHWRRGRDPVNPVCHFGQVRAGRMKPAQRASRSPCIQVRHREVIR